MKISNDSKANFNVNFEDMDILEKYDSYMYNDIDPLL